MKVQNLLHIHILDTPCTVSSMLYITLLLPGACVCPHLSYAVSFGFELEYIEMEDVDNTRATRFYGHDGLRSLTLVDAALTAVRSQHQDIRLAPSTCVNFQREGGHCLAY